VSPGRTQLRDPAYKAALMAEMETNDLFGYSVRPYCRCAVCDRNCEPYIGSTCWLCVHRHKNRPSGKPYGCKCVACEPAPEPRQGVWE
jgi:hypothetical protein